MATAYTGRLKALGRMFSASVRVDTENVENDGSEWIKFATIPVSCASKFLLQNLMLPSLFIELIELLNYSSLMLTIKAC